MRWEHRYLGTEGFPRGMDEAEVAEFCTLTPEALRAATRRRTDTNRLGFAIQAAHVRMTGRLLSAAQLVGQPVLKHLSAQLGQPSPDLASIRTLYGRQQTLYEHQWAVRKTLGLRDPGSGGMAGVTAFLRREAMSVVRNDGLRQRAMVWFYERGYLLPAERQLADMARAARSFEEARLVRAIGTAVPDLGAEDWLASLTAPGPGNGESLFDALRTTPAGRSTRTLRRQAAKVRALREMGADRLDLPSVGLGVVRYYAGRAEARAVGKLARIAEPALTIELACFLRLSLLRLSDQTARMADHLVAGLTGEARREAIAQDGAVLERFRAAVDRIGELAWDGKVPDGAFRDETKALVASLLPAATGTRSSRTRRALARRGRKLDAIIAALREADLRHDGRADLAAAFAYQDRKDDAAAFALLGSVSRVWRDASDGDEADARGMASAASAVIVKRALRNGTLSIPHSLDHRSPDERLVPEKLWLRDRARLVRDLGVPEGPEAFVAKIGRQVADGLEALHCALNEGALRIEAGGLKASPPRYGPETPEVDVTRRALFARVGEAQLPDILVAVDASVGLSRILLGRLPQSEEELVTLYGALIALGSDLTPAAVCRMVAGLTPGPIGRMVRRLRASGKLRAASDAAYAHLAAFPIASLWGEGATCSSDMMSLEASRRLWSARIDPRRSVRSVGTYTHVSDRWGVLYDQPVVLNRRQAGHAIEGALRQSAEPGLDRVAVDTHGHTHFAMGLAKLVGVDLCPRLRDLPSRKLYVPKGLAVPAGLEAVTAPTVTGRTVAKGWDRLLRLASSVRDGWCPATFALDKYGSAARGDAGFEAGAAIGKLIGTVYLCDYLTKLDFRREIGRTLSQGEAIHTLQRAIYAGPLTAKAGRTEEELTATSNALTLLTNVVMAWNAQAMQRVIDQNAVAFPDEHLRHVSPIAHAHVNMRGVMTFDLGDHRDALLGRRTAPQEGVGFGY